MQKKISLSFPIDETLDREIRDEAKATGLSRADVARKGLRMIFGLYPTAKKANKRKGTTHATR